MITNDLRQLEHILFSGSDEEKIAVFKQMRDEICDGKPKCFFDLARGQIANGNNDVRWQAIIVIGEYIPCGQRNAEIWGLIVEHCGVDDDMQDALATVLLEHLLQWHYDDTLRKIDAELRKGNVQLLDLVRRCWRLGQSEVKWQQLQRVIEERQSEFRREKRG